MKYNGQKLSLQPECGPT